MGVYDWRASPQAARSHTKSIALEGLETDGLGRHIGPHDGADFRPFVTEGGDALRVKMIAAAADDFGIGLVDGPGGLVGPLGT